MKVSSKSSIEFFFKKDIFFDLLFSYRIKDTFICCVFLLSHLSLSAQHHEKIQLETIVDGYKITRSLLPIWKKDIPDDTYKNVPFGMIKHVLTRFDIDRIQSAYEQYVIAGSDTVSWNNFVNERKIDHLTVFPKKLVNSSVGIFSGIDSVGNKVIIWDTNGNYDFSDDEVYSVPSSLLQDTVFSLEIPVQYYEDGTVRDTVVQLGFLPSQKYRIGGDTMDPDLGLTAFNRTNLIGEHTGEKFDYRFVIVPPLINNWHKGKIPEGSLYSMITLKKDGTATRRSMHRFDETVHFDGADWKVADYTGKEFVFERLAISPVGYRSGQSFQGTPPIEDYYSKINIGSLPRNKYLLIDFWGTWCKPCLEEIPNLVRFWKENRDKVTLVSVLYDNENQIEKARQIIADNGMDWIHVWDDMKDSKWVTPMGITAYPGFIFIGKDNVVLSSDERGDILKLVKETIDAEKE